MLSDIRGTAGRTLQGRGRVFVVFLAILPCIYLLILERPFFAADYNYLLRLLGRLSALFGMSLLSLTFLLNTRLNFLESLFGGIDKAYKAHHAFGTTAFLSLLLHPFFLAGTYLGISAAAAARFFLPGASFPKDLGIFGLFTMELFLVFTFFAKARAKYQNWKFVHRLLGVSFILGSLHVLLISSDVKSNIVLRSYMVLMILVGYASYIYRTLLWRRLVRRHDYVVDAVRRLGGAITELALAPRNEAISFVPGQFVFIEFDSGILRREPHPFTISSSASDRALRLSVKNLGDFTSDLKNAAVGTKVKIEGPYGRFCPALYGGKNQIWIAGGIGITPFLSIARSMEKYALGSVDLYYSVSNAQEAIFLGELNNLSSKNKNLKVIPFFSSEKGRINGSYVSAKSRDLKNKEIFICGPAAMMQALKSQFRSMGVPGSSIHLEEFEL